MSKAKSILENLNETELSDLLTSVRKKVDSANASRKKHGDDELSTVIWNGKHISLAPDHGTAEFDVDVPDKKTAKTIAKVLRFDFTEQ